MKKPAYLTILGILLFFSANSGASETNDESYNRAMAVADEITAMRSERAAALLESKETVTPQKFKETCGAVKQRAMALAKENGFRIKHAAIKYRNPDHKAGEQEIELHKLFESDSQAKTWDEISIEGKSFMRYAAPIFVEPACLLCHGDKDSRPEFIKQKYPDDKAYGFSAGDLRGIIEVMVPLN